MVEALFKRIRSRIEEINREPYELYRLEDLAHSLRLITDSICEISEKFSGQKNFTCWNPSRQWLNKYKKHSNSYFFCFLNEPFPTPNPPNKSGDYNLPLDFFNGESGYSQEGLIKIIIKQFVITDRFFFFSPTMRRYEIDQYSCRRKKNFEDWFDSGFIYTKFLDKFKSVKSITISRKQFIYRLSSGFGGSHPRGNAINHVQNDLISMIYDKEFGGISLAYILAYFISIELMNAYEPAYVQEIFPSPEIIEEYRKLRKST